MRPDPTIAVVGATGLVGGDIVALLNERKVPCGEARLFATGESAGEIYQIGDLEVTVEELDENSCDGVDLAILAVRPELAREIAPRFTKAGAVVLDTSSAFRGNSEIPLVVAGVSPVPHGVELISTPNAASVQLAAIVKVLEAKAGVKRLVVSTYHSVSTAGKLALDELWAQTRSVFNQSPMPNEAFQHQIAFNCIPQTDVFHDSGYTREELAIGAELRRVIGVKANFGVTVTAVRVPVFHGLSMAVNAELLAPLKAADFAKALQSVPGLNIHLEAGEYPMSLDVAGSDEVHIGRIRQDTSVPHGLDFWTVADNIRCCSALNVIRIAEALIKSE